VRRTKIIILMVTLVVLIYLVATWATKVKERWNDIEWVTCGPDITYCL
jgi:hypothetical protein